jgi:hypothetical protein
MAQEGKEQGALDLLHMMRRGQRYTKACNSLMKCKYIYGGCK